MACVCMLQGDREVFEERRIGLGIGCGHQFLECRGLNSEEGQEITVSVSACCLGLEDLYLVVVLK